jgi:hypothetical protein
MEILRADYNSKTHTFNKAIIASYYNLFKYPHEIIKTHILVHGIKRDVLFILDPNAIFIDTPSGKKKLVIYSETPVSGLNKKMTEVAYNLDELFGGKHGKEIRRAINVWKREDIQIRDSKLTSEDYEIKNDIFQAWKSFKQHNPKVFQISFNPDRYYRTLILKEKGFNIYEKVISVNGRPYGVIVFSLDSDRAYELTFISKYFDKSFDVVNDLNTMIVLGCFYDLWLNHGVKTINVGTDAGIKGLKMFKHKIPSHDVIVYTN